MVFTMGIGVAIYAIDISNILSYDSVPGMLQANCYLIFGFLISVVTFVCQNCRLRVLREISRISSQLTDEDFGRWTLTIQAKDILGFIFLAGQMTRAIMKSGSYILAAFKFLGMYTTLVVFLMDCQYMNLVCVLELCFRKINQHLIALRRKVEIDEPHLLRRVYHENKNPLILHELQVLKKSYQDVSDAVRDLNDAFCLQNVASIVLTFAEITFSLYFYILKVLGVKEINLEKQIWYSYFIMSVGYYAAKIAFTVWTCEITKDQALKTGILVHDVILCTSDDRTKEEMQLFSLQLLHRDNSFTAKGLSLDATLLSAIVGGITTYLLILIQFLLSSKSCRGGADAGQ
ncbi:gustatory receptor 23a-like [Orussus abietinus]|uniref:gustatory receptor 23a-like n=1 Tax=Orussus abietinus TaxID=222816 RepID=UPI000C71613A|nr:gustatory receptor 23a-like [Orussus abietinus]